MGSPAKLGRCPRCKAYALVDNAQGVTLAVDIAPVDALGYGVAVASGHRLWWVETGQKRPSRVVGPLSGSRAPSWGPGGAQTSIQKLHQEHGCGAPHRDIVIVPVSSPKGSAPATPGAPGAGNHHRDAPGGHSRSTGSSSGAGSTASPSPATSVTRPRSEPRQRAFRCDVCNRLVDRKTEEYLAIDHDTYAWGYHLECP